MKVFMRFWVLCVVLVISANGLFAQQSSVLIPPPMQPTPQANELLDVFNGKEENLRGHTFNFFGLTLSLNSERKFGSPDYLILRAKNPSNMFHEFHPEDLVLVDGNNIQQTLGISTFDTNLKVIEIPLYHIAPGATVSRRYLIFVKPPYKLYFGEKLIAEITS